MNNDIHLMTSSVRDEDLDLFMSKTKSNVTLKKNTEKITVDDSWIDKIIEAIPYLDNIIRNPRVFIAQEEDIIPIEKVRKVSEESIKHLAQNTSLIQDVDVDGTIKPLKLLNIFKEETIDLYENRFIHSLINNLYFFVQNQLSQIDEEESNKEVRTVNYEGATRFNKEDVTISFSLRSMNYEVIKESAQKREEQNKKVEEIRDILEDFMHSKFMKAMQGATPVRSPIRKTNVILKDQNFIYALRLWEFLESSQIETPIKKYNETVDLTSDIIESQYGMTYYLNYMILKGMNSNVFNDDKSKYAGLKKIIFDIAKDFDTDNVELRNIINNELKLANKFKQEQIKGINNSYKSFMNKHTDKMLKAMELIK